MGYDSDIVLEKTKESMLRVKNGECTFARDSVLFNKIQYSFPVIAGLLKAALANAGRLNVLDFGGSLGTSYYQCRNFLKGIEKLEWNIVDLPRFVACGKQFFENEELKFYYTIEECLERAKPNAALLSGVIQYVEEPYSLLDEIISRDFEYLIFDRTHFLEKGPDRLAIEETPSIFGENFPVWFFNYNNFIAKFLLKYRLIAEFDSGDKTDEPFFKGFILQLK